MQLAAAVARLRGVVQALAYTPRGRSGGSGARDDFDDDLEAGAGGALAGTGAGHAGDNTEMVNVHCGLVELAGRLARVVGEDDRDRACAGLEDIADQIVAHMPCHSYLRVWAAVCDALIALGRLSPCADLVGALLAQAPDPASRLHAVHVYTRIAQRRPDADVRHDVGAMVKLFIKDVQHKQGLPWMLRRALAQCLGAMLDADPSVNAWNLPDMAKVWG
jgi:hypothetical protein